jgi:uncharacterized membrane protein YhaH (DUF805 family)
MPQAMPPAMPHPQAAPFPPPQGPGLGAPTWAPPKTGGGFGSYLAHAFSNIFDYKTRASRAEYWSMAAIGLVFYSAYLIFMYFINYFDSHWSTFLTVTYAFIFFVIVFFILKLGLSFRRFHDVNLPGWAYVLAICFPFIMVFIIIITIIANMGSNFDRVFGGSLIPFLSFLAVLSALGHLFSFIITVLPSKPANKYGPGPWRPSWPRF